MDNCKTAYWHLHSYNIQILRIGVSNCLWLCVKNMYVVILMHSYKLFRCYVTVCSYYFPKVLIVLYLLVKHCTFNISCPWYQCVSQAKTHMCYSAHCNTHFNCWKQLAKCMVNLNCSTTQWNIKWYLYAMCLSVLDVAFELCGCPSVVAASSLTHA